MARVMERPASPSTTNRSSTNSSSSCNSRDSGKPRRTYRLFPSVEPTPPASPQSLQRANLRNSPAGGAHRRRSSSEDNGRASKDAQLPPQVLSHLSVSPPRDNSRKGSLVDLSPLRTVQENGYFEGASEGQPGLKAIKSEADVRAQPNYNVSNSARLGESIEACNTSSADAFVHRLYDERKRPKGFPVTTASASASAVALDELALPPARHIHAQKQLRPKLRLSVVTQREEKAPMPPPKSPRHSREASVETSAEALMQSPFFVHDKSTAREVRVASVALKGELKVRELTVAAPSRLRASQQPPNSSLANEFSERPGSSKAAGNGDKAFRTAAPPALTKESGGRWTDILSLGSRPNGRSKTPEPYTSSLLPDNHISQVRPATSQGPATTNTNGFSFVDHAAPARAATPENTSRSALAAARANVAALSIETPTWSTSFAEQIRTPGSDLGMLTSRTISQTDISDPLQTLAELGEQFEALHARYAALRSQRQQISTGIIANLKDEKPGPDYGNMLLNEQLSLAAVSSSIDICFAKLKSLECRREDAIAHLITQTAAARRPLGEEMGLMSRKGSLAPSIDSVKGLTAGCSTPDLRSLYNTNRPPPFTSHSYRTELEPPRFKSPMYPNKSPLVNEIVTENSPVQERHSKRSPPVTPGSPYYPESTSSVDDDEDDTQASEQSDIEDMHPEERLTKSQRPGAKAVKVLGMDFDDDLVSPIKLSGADLRKRGQVHPYLELINLDMVSRAGMEDVSPLTASTVKPMVPEARELEEQIQSFPPCPPVPETESKRNHRSTRHDSPMQRRDTAKSYASAHTINVYFEGYGDHEDMPLP